MENAPEKFLKRYPDMKEYISLNEKDINTDSVKRDADIDKFHHRGPIIFYLSLFIIIL